MREPLDVIIIGAGTAGLSALREVKKRTNCFAVININVRLPVYHPVFEEGLRSALRHGVEQLPDARDSHLARVGSLPECR